MTDFSQTASAYQGRAVVQQAAGEALLDLLAVASHEDVLDLACGPGALTARLRELTRGRMAGCDAAPGMIDEARRRHGAAGIEFSVCDAAALPFAGDFDAIFCNSAFQWFRDPAAVLGGCRNALRPGGRMAMQAPAKAEFCPNFIRAVETLRDHAETRDVYARYQSPWLFLESAANYAQLFADAGFRVAASRMEAVANRCTPEKALEIFLSGAAMAYLSPACYAGGFAPEYPSLATDLIADSLRRQCGADGLIELIFQRVFVLAYRNSDSSLTGGLPL
ncbi:MAG: methyltransferase domain-containing protein [Sulfuricella sp.]|nr:methyltransferase domain-containing protein [Sulfuricella sp.]